MGPHCSFALLCLVKPLDDGFALRHFDGYGRDDERQKDDKQGVARTVEQRVVPVQISYAGHRYS